MRASNELIFFIAILRSLLPDWVPFLEREVFLIGSNLLGNDGSRAASIILKRDSNLADMGRIILVVLVPADDILALGLQLAETRIHAVLRCIL